MRSFGPGELMFIIEAARWTIALSLMAFIGGGILGFLLALARSGSNKPLRILAGLYTQIFQGTPLLLQLFIVFFGLPILGLDVNPWVAAATALTLNTAAFLGEIWRGCIEAVPSGQWEASRALNLAYHQQLRDVVLPQAARISLPPTVGYLVQVVKGTSLTAIIGFTEITRAGQIINNATFQPLYVFTTVAALYLALCWPLSILSARMEQRLASPAQNH